MFSSFFSVLWTSCSSSPLPILVMLVVESSVVLEIFKAGVGMEIGMRVGMGVKIVAGTDSFTTSL